MAADASAVAALAADTVALTLADAVAARGRADWATTGGSTPAGIYRRLVVPPLFDAIPWADVHVWWGDDRYVSRADPLSNVKPLDDILLGGRPAVPLPADHVHPFPTDVAIRDGHGPAWCAATLADELRTAGLGSAGGWPVFDLIVLGVGGDGHVLSVFPDSAAFDSPDLALAVPAPTHIAPRVDRVTLNPAVIGVARAVLVVAHGADKAAVVAELLGGERDPRRLPGQLARQPASTWILDAAAAAAVRR